VLTVAAHEGEEEGRQEEEEDAEEEDEKDEEQTDEMWHRAALTCRDGRAARRAAYVIPFKTGKMIRTNCRKIVLWQREHVSPKD
jgi:hypothetical protein